MRLRLLLERICAQYGFGFFVQEKSKFVSSTASDRKGVVKGESVPLDRVLPTFARTKVGPHRVGVQMNTFCKTPRRRRRNKAGHSLCRQSLRFAPLTTSLYTREAFGWYASNSPYTGEALGLGRLFYSSAGVSVTFSSLASWGSAVSSPSASSASSSRGARARATTRLPSSRRIAWTPPP